jgi:hypothetical protein
MSAEMPVLVRNFRVGHRTVTCTVPPVRPGGILSMAVEWHPEMPRRLSPGELRQYRAGRDALMRELAQLTGLNTTVLDL